MLLLDNDIGKNKLQQSNINNNNQTRKSSNSKQKESPNTSKISRSNNHISGGGDDDNKEASDGNFKTQVSNISPSGNVNINKKDENRRISIQKW